jgi:hypothetical protein
MISCNLHAATENRGFFIAVSITFMKVMPPENRGFFVQGLPYVNTRAPFVL